jgi:hypothetical protein
MSNLRDFAATLADARERAARSVSQLLTPQPGVPSRSGSSFINVGRTMAGVSDSNSRLSPLTGDGVGSSGEFFPRANSGSGDLSVFVLTPEIASKVCLGSVTGGVKFCTRGNNCSIQSHAKKVVVSMGDIYISSNKNFAYSHPHISASLVGNALSTLLEETHPKEEWVRIFQDFSSLLRQESQVISALTPAKRKHRYVMESSNVMDEEFIRELASWDFESIPTDDLRRISELLKLLDRRLQDFQIAAGTDVDALYFRSQSLFSMIGSRPSHELFGVEQDDCSTLWETITILNAKISDCLEIRAALTNVQSELTSVTTHSVDMSTTLQVLRGDFGEMQQCIDSLKEFTQLLNTEQESFGKAILALNTNGVTSTQLPTAPLCDCASVLRTLQAKIELVEARLPTDPFVIGGRSFNSKADVALFVANHLDGISFSLFHDVVTLLESICGDHVLKSDVMTEWYHAGRVGLNEEEATHVASFKLTIPSEFGITKDSGVQNSKFPLPAVKTFDVWDPQDNVNGKVKHIRDGVNDVELSIRSTIETVCSNSPPARSLALDMLTASKLFIENLSTWMTSFYLELLKTSHVPSDEAWHLVAACVHQFFVVIREYRAPASKANTITDASLKTSTYLWALIQVHRTMKEIRDAQFRGHPSVAPIINLHVFKTRVTATAFAKVGDSIKALTKQVGDQQKFLDKLHDRISKLEKK